MIARLKAEKILRELNYDFSTFSISSFLDFVGKARGCSIVTIPWTMSNSLFGVWISDHEDAKEYIFYRDDLSKIYQISLCLISWTITLINLRGFFVNSARRKTQDKNALNLWASLLFFSITLTFMVDEFADIATIGSG